jgi:hypothetical protein
MTTIKSQQQTPGVVALIPLGANFIKFAAQKSLVCAATNERTNSWPVYSRINVMTREEVGQLLGGN